MTSDLSNPAPTLNVSYETQNPFKLHSMDSVISPSLQSPQTVVIHATALATLKTPSSKHKELLATHQQTLDQINFSHQIALIQLKREHEQEIVALKQRLEVQEENFLREIEQERMSANQRQAERERFYDKSITELGEQVHLLSKKVILIEKREDSLAERADTLEESTFFFRQQLNAATQKLEEALTQKCQLIEENKRLREENTQWLNKARKKKIGQTFQIF